MTNAELIKRARKWEQAHRSSPYQEAACAIVRDLIDTLERLRGMREYATRQRERAEQAEELVVQLKHAADLMDAADADERDELRAEVEEMSRRADVWRKRAKDENWDLVSGARKLRDEAIERAEKAEAERDELRQRLLKIESFVTSKTDSGLPPTISATEMARTIIRILKAPILEKKFSPDLGKESK